jgi:hypothetical protein
MGFFLQCVVKTLQQCKSKTIQRTFFPCYIPNCIGYFPVHFTEQCSGIYSKTDLENPGEKKKRFLKPKKAFEANSL